MKKEPDDKLPPEYLELLSKVKNVMIWAVILFISMLILLIILSQSVVLIISSAHDIILYTTVDLSIFIIILSILMYWIHNTLLGERYETYNLDTKLFWVGGLLSSLKLHFFLLLFPIPLSSLVSSYENVVWAALLPVYVFITYASVYLYLRRLPEKEVFKGIYETYNPQQSYRPPVKAIKRRDILLLSAFLAGFGLVMFFISGFYYTINSLCLAIGVGFMGGVKQCLQPHRKLKSL